MLVLFTLALTLPYVISVHRLPLVSFCNEFAAAAFWIAIVSLLSLMPRLAPHVALPRVAWVPASLALVLCLQTVVMTLANPMAVHVALTYLCVATLLTYAGYRLRDLQGLTSAVALAVIAGAVLSIAIQLIQGCAPTIQQGSDAMWFGLVDPRSNGRLYGNLAQPNHLNSYLAWALAGVLYLRERSTLGRYGAILLAVLVMLGMVATGSRTAPVQVALIGLVFGLVWWRRAAPPGLSLRQQQRRRAVALPVALLLGYFALYTLLSWLDRTYWHLGVGEHDMARLTTEGLSGRWQLYRYGWRMFLQTPWLGGGWGSFPGWQYANLEHLGTVEASVSAHDIVLDLLAQTGVLGCGLFLIGLATWAVRARVWALDGRRAFWLCMLGTVLLHALVEYPLNYTYFMFPAAFALGVLDTAPVRWSGARASSLLCTVMVPPVLAGLLLFASDDIKLDRLFNAPNELTVFPQYWKDQALILSRFGSYAVASGISVNHAHPDARLDLQRDALALMPMPAVVSNYVVALALLGRDDEALDQVRRMQLLDPDNYASDFGLLMWRCVEQGDKLSHFVGKLGALRPASAVKAVPVSPSLKTLMGGVPASAGASVPAPMVDTGEADHLPRR